MSVAEVEEVKEIISNATNAQSNDLPEKVI